ncbi:MAG: Cof-type HAD-IIB family hydrolase [Solobacterium sp.]|jgi:cof-like hydrolase|uniref:Cof-type HAD-IIB family hydrolase n=1 Tax=Solobacterium sp. TaxID=2060878 RepID=UPI001CB0FFF7|nr:Cof-type HAD-IIB family hydrolase [Solobacterium sp.]MBF1089311.1 Cof-type HAD-IIB family hydrolase [Solobacterium sp.]
MYDLSQMTYIEAKKKILLCDAIIVPLGSVEQHGYVLPLNTDNIICMHIINDLCERFNLAHLPLVPFGQTWSSSNFPGTISIAPTNMQNYICDIALSLEKAGAKKIIFYSFHNGNQEVIKQCARSLYEQYNNIYYLNSNNMKRICENIEEITFKHNIWHAGEIEVSLMMYLSPDDIRNNKLNNSEVDNNIADLKPMKWDRFNPNGSFGDTTLSSVIKGKKIYSNLLRELNEQVEKIISDNQRISDIELFVSDLDGTLLTNNKMVTTYSIEVINRLRENNVAICIATSRNIHMSKQIIKAIGDRDLYLISDNGAYVYDCMKNMPIYEKNINLEDAENVIKYLINNKHRFVAYSSSAMYCFLLNEEIKKKIIKVRRIEEEQKLDNLLVTKKINSFDDIDYPAKLLKIVIYLEQKNDINDISTNLKNDCVSFEQTGERYWSICHRVVSKENALRYLQKYLFINCENTIAFGDFDNDISLFKRAKYKVAMSNASDSLIMHSNYMTDTNDSDGVAKFLSEKIL